MTITRTLLSLLVVALVVVTGCSRPETAEPQPTGGESAAAPAPADQAPAAAKVATGTVLEAVDAATYTYVRVEVGDGEIWAATSKFEVGVGDRVTVPLDMPMQDFHSTALDRTFPLIYFAGRILRDGEHASPALPEGHPPVGGGAAPAAAGGGSASVEPAEGGLTVAQVWARRGELVDRQVAVRGRVVKVNDGILGRNWLHLQDGSGVADLGTHDLTVTSDGTASVGTVVTVTGTVVVDRDFGAGYSYALMLENATVVPSE